MGGTQPREAPAGDRQHGIQSIEVGMRLLDAFAAIGAETTLSALATRAGMHPAKAHRYLVSLIRAGYIAQNAATGGYGLGPHATALGLAALRRLDVARLGEDIVRGLSAATGHTVSLVVWANRGPTIVDVAEADTLVTVRVRIGSVLPLLASANGPLFLAFLPQQRTQPLLAAELAARTPRRGGPYGARAVAQLVAEVRRRKLSRSAEGVHAGVVSLAAPVFDHRGELACTIALVGAHGDLQLAWDGAPARALTAAAARLSARLGAPPPDGGREAP
jgi:DNA-binding IclR family transcriptional regulator